MDSNASISSTILPARKKIQVQLPVREAPFVDPININYEQNEQNEQNSDTKVYNYKYKAIALHDYRGSPEDRTELSFAKGEYFDIANKECKWWNARKADGTTGIVPGNYMQIIDTRIYDGYKYKAMALYDYRGRQEYRTELSFAKGEYLDIASKKGSWWKARKADGTTGFVPNNYNFRVDVNPFKDFNNFNQIYEQNEQKSDFIVNKINPFNINYEQKEQNSDTRVHDGYKYKAKALYDYYGSPEDPTELSFVKGEYLDIANKEFKWWNARKADGTTGIAPSNYVSYTILDI
ncbi:hypothetical protein F8M41_016340 [Gigaspora margarita]|uniref:SH3 domain-containing protein n=1 Tax=Gigaspora margarita TaxID=4874 RepID=A0A8H4APJ1_GIGMA|nr:hypothetical protein F8M41_016340 [Gigaspora margarita]